MDIVGKFNIMNKYNMYIPNEIINYCILFMFLFHEKFDSENIGITHTLNGNVITGNKN